MKNQNKLYRLGFWWDQEINKIQAAGFELCQINGQKIRKDDMAECQLNREADLTFGKTSLTISGGKKQYSPKTIRIFKRFFGVYTNENGYQVWLAEIKKKPN